MTALGCLTRLEQFLLTPPRVDTRTSRDNVVRLPADIEKSASSSDASGAEFSSHKACISVRGGTFGWEDGSPPVLRNLNFTINSRDIIFVQGPVGCGKSTLMKALLGETPVSSASITLSHLEIAFCEQSPWLMVGVEQPSRICNTCADFAEQVDSFKYHLFVSFRCRVILDRHTLLCFGS